MATNAITLGYAQITSSFTLSSSQGTPTQVTGLTISVTIPSGGRKVKITVFAEAMSNASSGDFVDVSLWDGTVNSGTKLAGTVAYGATANAYIPCTVFAVVTPSAGSKTYNVGINNDSGARNVTLVAGSTIPAFILVEAI